MENHDRCPSCGALVLPEEKFCRQCGAALQGDGALRMELNYDAPGAEPAWQPGTTPRTIAALEQYCQYNQMPLERMRFFLNQDTREPRAFGIYEDGGEFVVYKNKADGSRAVRYHGPDEAYAVNEIYTKLLDECHRRNIWPDGKPEGYDQKRRQTKTLHAIITFVIAIAAIAVIAGIFIADHRAHANDGYYRFDDDGIYYLYGGDWYYDDPYDDWVAREPVYYDDYTDYYMGSSYDTEWGYSDFRQSETWDQIQEDEHTTSSDYSDWDSGDTDWDSDW